MAFLLRTGFIIAVCFAQFVGIASIAQAADDPCAVVRAEEGSLAGADCETARQNGNLIAWFELYFPKYTCPHDEETGTCYDPYAPREKHTA